MKKVTLENRIRVVVATFFLALLGAAVFSTPSRGQLQQSGGPGSTVTANIGTTNGLALDATLTSGTLKAEPYDGTNVIGTAAHPVQVSLANTATNGTAVKVDGSAVTQPVSGTFWQATQPVSGTVTVNALPAGSNLVGYTRAGNACGTTNYESGMQFLPSASTQLTATATCATVLILNNTSASAVTVSVQDQSTACNSGACNILSSFSIPPNSQLNIPLYGAKFTGGIKWNAGSANVVMADVIGNQ